MAAINDLISQIADVELRERIQREVDKMNKQKKFGLVFEEHLPECTPLYDMPVKRGCNVMLRNNKEDKSVYVVLYIDGENAVCVRKNDKEAEKVSFALNDIVRVAEFGEPIYPYLKPIDSVCNAPDSGLWHTLIEADNYHALQLFEYLYAGKVDCIYIDPPYNTGARDWKYNNDYVDGNDAYRHSKWLSMMQKRLKIAKKLLNPNDSVLIVTIDEKEYLHLGCLLEEMFPEARIQMVSSVINPNGATRSQLFTRVDEYIFFVMFGECSPIQTSKNMLDKEENQADPVYWFSLTRSGSHSSRADGRNAFFPIYIDKKTERIVGAGDALPLTMKREEAIIPDGVIAVWPLRDRDNGEACWQLSKEEFLHRLDIGAIRLGIKKGAKRYSITYIRQGHLNEIEKGNIKVVGKDENGAMLLESASSQKVQARTVWNQPSHDATTFGTKFLINLFGENRKFAFPKSVYAVQDTIYFFVANKPNAIIIDFFAGSGTTLNAVNLLNAEDGGQRRCVMVTNNEVSDAEFKELTENGYKPGDDEWEKLGIARNVTWPRTVCSIEGHDVNGIPLKGNYLGSDIPMADGFKANTAFFKLGFLDKTSVALGMRFKEMLPTLWMKAGAIGKCPEIEGESIPDFLILPKNQFAVLLNENAFASFAEQLTDKPEIQTVFINTDYEVNYRAMAKELNVATTYQLYRDYLDHFRINHGRN